MNAQTAFNGIRNIIRQKKNYVPRDYQTIGGMWTVDTWQLGDVKYKLMDEGYTSQIISPSVNVIQFYDNSIEFKRGSESDLIALYENFKE